ncbi:MAG: YifB family Mg chelatase-like AAA ATPase [Planctomycetaceae bacterium]|nr:YifB family Mg chelatase-like AAA ATPase [Planctomycetales bacterium]MCB9927602.1 YifB family Mg chelatase-like AAA ATPase [Planctomycetaceae bacterium]
MLAKLNTFSLLGIEALPVEVEVDVSPGAIPKTVLVGLPEAAVKESTHRVERAIVNSGFLRPQDRIVINLAPAELPKQAASFDLPITLGILAGSGQIGADMFEQYAVVGELSLEGATRPVKGALSMAIAAARQKGLRGLIVPAASAREAAVVEDIEVIAVESLSQAVGFFSGELEIEPTPSGIEKLFDKFSAYEDDFSDVRGQEMAKRALTIAAAGAHNLLMIGPPGSGKTMLAKRTPTILPPLSAAESIETTRIYSAVGRLAAGQPLMARRPFRDPHHTISDAGLVGGGSTPAPGEISLSHNGVLFLDELPEFNRRTLEVLRQPLEDGTVTISRALTSTTFPADFILIAALNPCPCGYRNDPRRDCHCSVPQIERYMAKVSGPLLDRIDIHIEVPAVPFQELTAGTAGTSSEEMRAQVIAARQLQSERFARFRVRSNAKMKSQQIRRFCPLDEPCANLLKSSVNELGLSARAHDKVLRVARTIADLDGSLDIQQSHLHEAVNYRMLDRNIWT